MIERKSWEEFRNTGLLLFVNSFLHIFGWSIILEIDDEFDGGAVTVYPARVGYRGFNPESVDLAYKRVAAYMEENGSELRKETED